MSSLQNAGGPYRKAVLAAALVGGTVAAGMAIYCTMSKKKASKVSKDQSSTSSPTSSSETTDLEKRTVSHIILKISANQYD